MRYSKQRELVMQQVETLRDHPTAEEIYQHALKECPGLSLGTVYRNLNSLVEAGRVRRVSIPGQPDRFDHTLPWHGHLYCTCCGQVEDLDLDPGLVRQLLSGQPGRITDCVVTWIGLCERCSRQSEPAPAACGAGDAGFAKLSLVSRGRNLYNRQDRLSKWSPAGNDKDRGPIR